MHADFDIRPMVEKYSAIPMNRLRVLRNADELNLTEIRRGIVFVFAGWSGPSVQGFRRFTKIVKEFEVGNLDVVVLDIDCLTKDLADELFGSDHFAISGSGEAMWIRDGKVVAHESTHNAPDGLIVEHTRRLVSEDKA